MAETKLSVKNLTVSFRTANGKVQAVRGISFDLAKGETLSIVGESGSGKSVTSKAILGILAGNSIVEGGEIIYDGKDLLKISEDDFHAIRGDKIAMIFQDPMSSLNPIVKIGRQLTEAMILKGKARQKESRIKFNAYLKNLNEAMIGAMAADNAEKAAQLTEKCKKFDTFERRHIELEAAYNTAHEAAIEAVDSIEVLLFEMEKNQVKDAAYRIAQVVKLSKTAVHDFVVKADAGKLAELAAAVSAEAGAVKKGDYKAAADKLAGMKDILAAAAAKPAPDFFAMGYYLAFSGKALPEKPVEQLNEELQAFLADDFMRDFVADAKQGVAWSAEQSYAAKAEAIKALRQQRAVFEKKELVKAECDAAHKLLTEKVTASINKLDTVKDSMTYTFPSALGSEIAAYFKAIGRNVVEQKKHEQMQAKYDKLVASGKTPDWKVPAAAITDLELVKYNIQHQIDRMTEHFEASLAAKDARDYDVETAALIEFLKESASGIVNKVTQSIAKAKAIKLMEEVGIAEPRKRYNQYPFEFSGGMRQRIVIAIALAANPDILICDEPTTALDVTIQSQILELINKLKRERQLSVIFITHDLGVVANMADRIAVMYAGKIVETGTAEDVFYHAAHPYTWALLSSMPDLDTNDKLEAIPGTPPNMIYPPKGDAFAPRNKYAMQIDFEEQPPMFQISDTHYAATWLLHPDAPKVEPPKVITDRIARMKAKRGEQDGE